MSFSILRLYQHRFYILQLSAFFILLSTSFVFTPLSLKKGTDNDLIDGRFTIGYGKKSLLFGYPYSYSSSHFIIQSSGKYASNNPSLSQTRSLKGSLLSSPSSNNSKVIYTFDNLTITQTLTPVNEKFNEMIDTSKGIYYAIEYQIENHSDTKREVEFMLLLDPMIAGDDRCKVSADGSNIGIDSRFENSQMPFHFSFYDGNLQTRLVTKHDEKSSPDMAYVGQWAHLTNVLYLEQQQVKQYTDDSAILLRWNEKTLPKGKTRTIKTYFGVPHGKLGVRLQHHKPMKQTQIELYFAPNQSTLSEQEENRLRSFMATKRCKAALVEGYTDAKGTEKRNLQLSKDRIDNVSFILQMVGVKYERILRKSHGEFFAKDGQKAEREGEKDDRKVVVTVWK